MFKITAVPSRLKASIKVLALGTETRLRVSWSLNGRLYSLEPQGRDRAAFVDFYESASLFLLKKYNFSPEVITFDPHPGFSCAMEAQYLKNRFFKKAVLYPVYHHVAHVARFAIENGPKKKFIGLAFDGTGYGMDKKAWGSEFFVRTGKKIIRRAHFDYMMLAGGDAAIKEPWRIALGLALKIEGEGLSGKKYGFLKGISRARLGLVRQMLEKKFNIAYSSSAGRLFDAMSSILKTDSVTGLESEAKGSKIVPSCFPFDIRNENGMFCVDFSPMFKEVLAKNGYVGKERRDVARRFHNTVACASSRVCRILKAKYAVNNVYLSGGVFLNDLLCLDMKTILEEDGFNVLFAKRPYNTDLGISEGQIAAVCLEKN